MKGCGHEVGRLNGKDSEGGLRIMRQTRPIVLTGYKWAIQVIRGVVELGPTLKLINLSHVPDGKYRSEKELNCYSLCKTPNSNQRKPLTVISTTMCVRLESLINSERGVCLTTT